MSGTSNTPLLNEVANYYAERLAKHGETPRGVDWNGEESQVLRFEQLCKIIPSQIDTFSLNDLGCGYGALLDFLMMKQPGLSYCGIDISADMVLAANARHVASPVARFICAERPDKVADFTVASGIFNVRMERNDKEWFEYLLSVLDVLNESSQLGFAFNCLTSYSDENKKRDYLYYADPCQVFDICKRRYSKEVALLHDYGLFEFTILVRKT